MDNVKRIRELQELRNGLEKFMMKHEMRDCHEINAYERVLKDLNNELTDTLSRRKYRELTARIMPDEFEAE